MYFRCITATVALCLAATAMEAAPISFGFNAGPVVEIDDDFGDFDGFLLGEDLFLEVTMDDSTLDVRDEAGTGRFRDLAGFFTITGLSSGTSITTLPGVDLQLDDASEIEFDDATNDVDENERGFVLEQDVDINLGDIQLSDVDDFATVFAEISALIKDGLFAVNESTNTARIDFNVEGGNGVGRSSLTFGAVPSIAPVPLPAPALFLISGLVGLGALRLRRKGRR